MHQGCNDCCVSRDRDILVDAIFGWSYSAAKDPGRDKDSACKKATPQDEKAAHYDTVAVVNGTEAEEK